MAVPTELRSIAVLEWTGEAGNPQRVVWLPLPGLYSLRANFRMAASTWCTPTAGRLRQDRVRTPA
jgi:hypothetical protein